MRRLRLGSLVSLVLVPLLGTPGTPAHASDGLPPIEAATTQAYRLTDDSAWLEGCIVGPCLCPVLLRDDLIGRFLLVELPTFQPGPWRLFEVADLRWSLGEGDARVEIRGSGLYRTAAPVLDEHRLVLNLERDGDPIETLDSGVVPGASSFPEIRIQALTPGYCYQEGVWLSAVPAPEPSQRLQWIAGLLALTLLSRRRLIRETATFSAVTSA